MWYAFVPGEAGLQRYFTGLTDNCMRFRSYCKLMEEYDVENIMPVVEFNNYDKCADAVKFVLNEFPNYGDYDSIGIDFIVSESELTTITGWDGDTHIVIPQNAYDYFDEVVMNTDEIKKMMNSLYRLCHSYSLLVFSYFKYYNIPDGKFISDVVDNICKLWKIYGDIYKNHGAFSLMKINPDSLKHELYIWSLFDKSAYLRVWMEMVIKNGKVWLPMGCLGDM